MAFIFLFRIGSVPDPSEIVIFRLCINDRSSEGLHASNGVYGTATGTTSSTTAMPVNKFDVNDIVMHFGREYYTTLSCHPERLHCFYGKQSSLLHCQEEDTEAAVCVGLEEIHWSVFVRWVTMEPG